MSLKEKRCEWCGATEDLTVARIGPTNKPQRLWVCNNQRQCKTRWPDEFPPGTLGAPEPKRSARRGPRGEG